MEPCLDKFRKAGSPGGGCICLQRLDLLRVWLHGHAVPLQIWLWSVPHPALSPLLYITHTNRRFLEQKIPCIEVGIFLFIF